MVKKLKIHIIYNHVSGAEKDTPDTKLALEFVEYIVQILTGLDVEFVYFHNDTLLGQRKFKFFGDLKQADIILVVITPKFEKNEFAKLQNDAAFNERMRKKQVIPLMVGENTELLDVFTVDGRILSFDTSTYRQDKRSWEVLKRSIKFFIEGGMNGNNGGIPNVENSFANGTGMSGLLSDRGLNLDVASKIGVEWSTVALNLGLLQAEIEQIQLDNPGQTVKQITTALIRWRDRQKHQSEDEIIESLLETLKECDRADLVKQLKEKYGTTGRKCYRPDDLLKVLSVDQKKSDHVEECLKKNCDFHNLEFDGITPANGNCLFEAVSRQLERLDLRPMTPGELRQSVTEYLRNNREYQGLDGPVNFEGFVQGRIFDEYLDNMSRDGEWGDHVIILGLSLMLHRNIVIITSSPETVQENSMTTVIGDNSYTNKPLLLGHYWENHYQSLKPNENEYMDVSEDGPSIKMVKKSESFTTNHTTMKQHGNKLGITSKEECSKEAALNNNATPKNDKDNSQQAVHSNMVYCSDRGSHTKTGDIIHISTGQPKTKFPGTGEPLGGVGIEAKTDMTDSVKARERRNQSFLGTFTQDQSKSVKKESNQTENPQQKTDNKGSQIGQGTEDNPDTNKTKDADTEKLDDLETDKMPSLHLDNNQQEENSNSSPNSDQSKSVKKESNQTENPQQKTDNKGSQIGLGTEDNPDTNKTKDADTEKLDDLETDEMPSLHLDNNQQEENSNSSPNSDQSKSVKKESNQTENPQQKTDNKGSQIGQGAEDNPDTNKTKDAEKLDDLETDEMPSLHLDNNQQEENSNSSPNSDQSKSVKKESNQTENPQQKTDNKGSQIGQGAEDNPDTNKTKDAEKLDDLETDEMPSLHLDNNQQEENSNSSPNSAKQGIGSYFWSLLDLDSWI